MIALLGASGYVGQAFRRVFNAADVPYVGIGRGDVDCYDARRLATALRERRAEFLINCADYTGRPNVDACQDHKTEGLLPVRRGHRPSQRQSTADALLLKFDTRDRNGRESGNKKQFC